MRLADVPWFAFWVLPTLLGFSQIPCGCLGWHKEQGSCLRRTMGQPSPRQLQPLALRAGEDRAAWPRTPACPRLALSVP